MAGTAGKKMRVYVAVDTSGSAGTYYLIQGMRNASLGLEGTMIDDSEFGNEFMKRLIGLKDFKISLSGNRNLADTNGQNFLQARLLSTDALCWIKFLPDDGATANVGFISKMIMSKFSVSAAVDGAADLTVELENAGTPVAA